MGVEWGRRLRWRLRGAWQWPAFVVITLLDTLLLSRLPIAGTRIRPFGAFLVAGFANIAAVGLAAPLAGRALRLWRRDLPRVVAVDYAGTAMLLVVTAALAAAGVAHHSAIVRERRAATRALGVMRAWVEARAPAAVRRNVEQADTIRVDPGRVYRSCIPAGAAPYCVLVRLDASPPRVIPSGHEPNAMWDPRGF